MITLATLGSATEQEVFDQVATHLLTQKQKCLSNEGGGCSYRNNGLKCAAGCLIGDDEYYTGMERRRWNRLVENGVVPGDHVDLITKLQSIHDNNDPSEWRMALWHFANEYRLDSRVTGVL
jgi:hypothetical protein